MPTTADQRTKMTGDRYILRRSTTTFSAPEAPRTKQHLQEGGDDDAAAARTSPRVSPDTRGAVRGGVYPTPFRKVRRHPQVSPHRGRTSRQRILPTQTPTTTPDES